MLWRRKPRLTPEQVLRSRPVRNPALRSEPIEGGGIRLISERRNDWWVRLLALLFPVPRERIVELDAAGRDVWELCDGETTLREMTRAFQERHKLTRAEAEWSLRTYLRDLGKRGLVGFVVEKVEGKKGKQGEQAHGKRA